MSKHLLKRIFLGIILLSWLSMTLFIPGLVRPVIANSTNIPTVTYSNGQNQALVPDWSRITWSSLPPIQTPGGISIPPQLIKAIGYNPSRKWSAQTKAENLIMLGDVASAFGLQEFALAHISNLTGLNLRALKLSDFDLTQWQTIGSLVEAIPGLSELPIQKIGPIKDLVVRFADGADITSNLGSLLKQIPDIAKISLSELDLSKYGLDSIPGLTLTPLSQFRAWQQSFIGQIPGLNLIPFSLFPFSPGFGVGLVARADVVWGKSEYGDPSGDDSWFVSGSATGGTTQPKKCEPNLPCAYLELSDFTGNVSGWMNGKRWASGETQQVPGGHGVLSALNGGLEPTGRLVFGPAFKVVIINTTESTGTVDFGLYFRVCIKGFIDLGCSPYFIGPLPIFSTKEKDLIVLGSAIPPVVKIPDRFTQQIQEILAKIEDNTSSTPQFPQSSPTPKVSTPNPQPPAAPSIEGDGKTTGTFAHPVKRGTRVSSPYGPRSRPISGKAQFHKGIDYAAPIGTPVKAIDGGVVVAVSSNGCADFGSSAAKRNCGGQLGNWIDVKHSNGLISRYGHLQKGSIKVQPGMKVSKGQGIAAVGSSGWSTGPHLDLRIHDGRGNYQNPDKFIRR